MRHKGMTRVHAEIFFAAMTGLGKVIFMDWLELRLPFIVCAVLGWSSYLVYTKAQHTDRLPYWGFRLDNIRLLSRTILPYFIFATLILVTLGIVLHRINITWHIAPLFLLYPVWGIFQQFLMMALVAGNLSSKYPGLSRWFILIVTSSLFAIIHYPDPWLIGGTWVLGAFYTHLYLENKNLYVLGTFHGWIGAIYYYTLTGRDPFVEVFGK